MKRDLYRRIENARRRHGLDPHIAAAPVGTTLKAYRAPGRVVVVTVTRPDGRQHRYRVGTHHLRELTARFNALNWGGCYLHNTLELRCHRSDA